MEVPKINVSLHMWTDSQTDMGISQYVIKTKAYQTKIMNFPYILQKEPDYIDIQTDRLWKG